MIVGQPQPKLPLGPLIDWCDRQWQDPNGEHGQTIANTGKLTTLLGISRSTALRWQKDGVPLYIVDEALTRKGVTIWDVWHNPHADLAN